CACKLERRWHGTLCRAGDAARAHGRRYLDCSRSVPCWLARDTTVDPRDDGIPGRHFHHIIIGELPTLLGIVEPQGILLSRLIHILGHVRDANLYALALGVGVLVVTLGTASISSKIPGAFFGLFGAGIAVALFHLQSRGVSVLGALSVALPHLALPSMP